MQAGGADKELVFKIGCGHGDAALHFIGAQGGVERQVDSAIEEQVAATHDEGGEGDGAQVRAHDGVQLPRGIAGLQCGEAGGQHRSRLVSGGAHGGFVFGQNRAGNDGGEHLALGLGFREHLVADAGVFHVERNHFAQTETEDGECFSGLGGQGIEVENEDADHGVGQDDGHGAGARGNLIESAADGGGNGFGSA